MGAARGSVYKAGLLCFQKTQTTATLPRPRGSWLVLVDAHLLVDQGLAPEA